MGEVLIVASTAASITGVIAVVAFCACRGGQIDGVAVAAGCAFMVNSTLITETGVRTVITGIPVAGVVTGITVIAEHSPVECRIGVAAGAEGRRAGETLAMAALTSQVGMCSRQAESG